ncbi:MAG: hypothetical protein JWR32_5983 [Mycobacterium sp.]|jgi:hypothetical protein|nr:hypothetical protein [Mycobacterium sp.]
MVNDRAGEPPQFVGQDGVSPTVSRPGAAALSQSGPMSSFEIEVTRDGGRWMVHIPELDGLTQARSAACLRGKFTVRRG